MLRGSAPSLIRCLAVWLLVTAGALVTWSVVGGTVWSLASSVLWRGQFDDVLVAVASAALVACAGWLWLVTTATVAELVTGRTSANPRGLTRRLVLVACGVAVAAGVGGPALAGVSDAGGGAREWTKTDSSLSGLPMPDRAVEAERVAPIALERAATAPVSRAGAAAIIVRDGDSLWSIAAARLGPRADVKEIDAAWRELYAANRDAIGVDPDLIRPGLDLEPDLEPDAESTREARP